MRGFRVERHGGPDALLFREDLALPVPAPGEVRIAVRACALNRLDLWLRGGVAGHRFPLPLTPGSDIAGLVDALGPGVDGIEIGTPVLVAPGVSCGRCVHCTSGSDPLCPEYAILGEHRDGGYAEFVVVPRRNLFPIPAGLSFAEAAAIPLVFLTAWHMLVARAELRADEDVLVHAAGSGVSSAAIQIARLFGARRIFATASTPEKLAKAAALGVTHGIDSSREDFFVRVRTETEGRGVDVVVDHVGGETFEKSVRLLARGGRIVFCGATAGAEATIHLKPLFFKSLSILGSSMGALAEMHRLLPCFAKESLSPVISKTYPFEAAREAQGMLATRDVFGKIVLTMDA